MTTVYDVPAHALILELAKDLKENKKLKQPEFAMFVKTGSHKERAPHDPDWWYIRMASILRKTYIDGPVTVKALRNYYGGKKRRGVRPPIFRRASGKIIRVCLQDLGKLNLIKITEKKEGRMITPDGQKFVDKISADLFKKLYPGKKSFETKRPVTSAVKEVEEESTQ